MKHYVFATYELHPVTPGGAGVLVAGAVRSLVRAGHRVTVFDNLSKGHRAAVPEAARFHFGDLGHPGDIDEAMQVIRPDAVFHFAALIEAGESMKQPAPELSETW